MDFFRNADGVWGYFLAALSLVMAVVASGHALLYKRDSRAAALWVALTWFVPIVGALFYFVFGINRMRRQGTARSARAGLPRAKGAPELLPEALDWSLPPESKHLLALARVVNGVAQRPLSAGNDVRPLINGDEAYPAMLDAIAAARHSISLSTYIFDHDEIGLTFAKALGDAARRGVEVRVLIDATGTRYSFPTILGALRREGVRYARFLPAFPLWRVVSLNLRNHRKILVLDGRIGFTGGMNIRQGHQLRSNPAHPVQDLQFIVQGAVVSQLQEVFAEDWQFTTREVLQGEKWFPALEPAGTVIARGISDGPDENYEKLRWTILGALTAARKSVRIVTPYFLPDPSLISTLNLAAMRGVEVDIILPAQSNLPFVTWASRAHWWQMLKYGCRIWLTPGPFDHSKMMVMDGCWSLIGSANWDPRSLRLNFEFDVECYDCELASRLGRIIEEKMVQAREVTLEEVDSRRLPARLRDGIARLMTPYL
jgi:cardiolipin synthase A/B